MRSLIVIALAAAAGLALLLPSTATGALIERDFQAAGDGRLTFDSFTGLEWLDLTDTENLSLNDSIAAFGGFGFRVATQPETCALVLTYTFATSCPNDGTETAAGGGNVLSEIQGLFGLTLPQPNNLFSSFGFFTTGALELFYFVDIDTAGVVFGSGTLPPDQPFEWGGHFLVREVPEPGSAALLLLALGCSALVRRRRRRFG